MHAARGRQDHGVDAGPVDAGFQIRRLKWDLPFFRERLASLSVRLLMETTWTSLSFSKAFM